MPRPTVELEVPESFWRLIQRRAYRGEITVAKLRACLREWRRQQDEIDQ